MGEGKRQSGVSKREKNALLKFIPYISRKAVVNVMKEPEGWSCLKDIRAFVLSPRAYTGSGKLCNRIKNSSHEPIVAALSKTLSCRDAHQRKRHLPIIALHIQPLSV